MDIKCEDSSNLLIKNVKCVLLLSSDFKTETVKIDSGAGDIRNIIFEGMYITL